MGGTFRPERRFGGGVETKEITADNEYFLSKSGSFKNLFIKGASIFRFSSFVSTISLKSS
ncbi:hypothetical protein SAMN05216311_109265 [Chitinophaga sp. CF418]|nr:hypothetical protein SAMN05216311_109265 [Chitinophaga sp. CF418]